MVLEFGLTASDNEDMTTNMNFAQTISRPTGDASDIRVTRLLLGDAVTHLSTMGMTKVRRAR